MSLTERQEDILEVIRESLRSRGLPPTVREIGAALGIASPNSVALQLNQLEIKGYIRRHPRLSRGIQLTRQDESNERTDRSSERRTGTEAEA